MRPRRREGEDQRGARRVGEVRVAGARPPGVRGLQHTIHRARGLQLGLAKTNGRHGGRRRVRGGRCPCGGQGSGGRRRGTAGGRRRWHGNVGCGSRRHVAPDIERGVRRLIVGGVLPGDGFPVLPIMHEGIKTVRRGGGGREDHQLSVVRISPDHLLTPIAKQVRGQSRIGFGGIVRFRSIVISGEEPVRAAPRPIIDHLVIQDLTLKVAIPENTKIDAWLRGRIGVARAASYVVGGTPAFKAPVIGVDIEGQASPNIDGGWHTPQDAPGQRVPEIGPHIPIGVRVLMRHPDLLPRAVGVHIREMERVPVPQARAIEARTIMIDGTGPVDDLVLPIGVHIPRGEAVRALARVGAVPRRGGIESPTFGKGPIAPIPSHEDGSCVIPTTEDRARLGPIQIGGASEEAIHTVPVGIPPRADRATDREIERGGHLLTRRPIEHRQEFRPREHITARVAVIIAVDDRRGVPQAQVGAGPILGAGRRLAHQLGFPVTVKIIDLELGIVGARADVLAQVDPPQSGALQLIAIEVDVPCITRLGIVLGIRRVPLDEDLIFPVPVHIPRATVVGGVGVRDGIGAYPARGLLEIEGPIEIGPHRGDLGHGGLFAPTHHRTHAIDRGGGTRCIGVVRDGEGRGVDLGPVPIEVERRGRGVGPQDAPTHKDIGTARVDRHKAATEVLHGGSGPTIRRPTDEKEYD